MLSPHEEQLRVFYRCAACGYSMAEIPHATACPECGETGDPNTLVVELIGTHPMTGALFGLGFALAGIGVFLFGGPLAISIGFVVLGMTLAVGFTFVFSVHGREGTHSFLALESNGIRGTCWGRGGSRSWNAFEDAEVVQEPFGKNCWSLVLTLRNPAPAEDVRFVAKFRAAPHEAFALEQYLQERILDSAMPCQDRMRST